MTRDAHVILASAGSGKTWQLTTHYLKLVCAGVPPEQILASTFTRKAAAEILARVFERLARAASDERGRSELDAAVGGGPRTCEQYRDLLARTARGVHRLRIDQAVSQSRCTGLVAHILGLYLVPQTMFFKDVAIHPSPCHDLA